MASKHNSSPSKKLIDLMGREPDWEGLANREPNSEISDTVATVAQGEPVARIDEGIRAMLIMAGCTAKFIGSYWLVTNNKTAVRQNVSLRNDYEEWRRALNEIGRISNSMQFGK